MSGLSLEAIVSESSGRVMIVIDDIHVLRSLSVTRETPGWRGPGR